MLTSSLLLLASTATSVLASNLLTTRQDSPTSNCSVYGIDFVDGGSYFINSDSTANFTVVQQFSGCNDDEASVLLVQQSTEEEWECTSVPTLPSNTSELSTCPLEKDQMSSGEWTILVIGNNGDGNPFAYERDFSLTVGPQETTTVIRTVTFTQISIPVVNATVTSELDYTSTVNNTQTITEPAQTDYITIVPSEVTTTETQTIYHTFTRWRHTQGIVTETVTPSCTVPPRPSFPDPWATFVPTLIPLPWGLHWKRGDVRIVDPRAAISRLERHRAKRSAAARKVAKRSPDVPTVTSTASIAVNTTVTSVLATSTNTFTVFSSNTVYSTLPPITARAGIEYDTITAPTPTDTVSTAVWSQTVVTSTLSLVWTLTETSTPSALASSCKAEGGHFAYGGSWWW
ncbi:hypothetical protein Q7P35_008746 [Cladosporium inversicolor]